MSPGSFTAPHFEYLLALLVYLCTQVSSFPTSAPHIKLILAEKLQLVVPNLSPLQQRTLPSSNMFQIQDVKAC